jgi:hypothetical protein
VTAKKVARPVYLKQLGDLLRSSGGKTSSDDPHEADKIEMGLNCAEELIRKKRDYGTELGMFTLSVAKPRDPAHTLQLKTLSIWSMHCWV